MTVDTTCPLRVQAHVLKAPVLKYGNGSKPATIVSLNLITVSIVG
jgi:hypothetical protein